MKASSIAENITACVRLYGDREIRYMARKSRRSPILFEEDITTIMVARNDPNDPMVLCGDNYLEIPTGAVYLNWFGKLIKKLIVAK